MHGVALAGQAVGAALVFFSLFASLYGELEACFGYAWACCPCVQQPERTTASEAHRRIVHPRTILRCMRHRYFRGFSDRLSRITDLTAPDARSQILLTQFHPLCMTPTPKKDFPKVAAPKEAAEHMTNTKTVTRTSGNSTAGQSAGESRGPVKQFREGDVSASVFARERNGTTFHSVSFTRSYKDRDGQWKYTKNFDVDDLGKLVTVAQRSAEYVHGLAYPDAALED